MTFYEAALRVLEEAKRPLTHNEITKLSLEKGLLSHIGKTPEMTMLSRLAAMAKRPRDRKVMITAKDTFALADWMLPEDAAAAETTGVAEPNPEEAMPQYRATERHPESRGEFVRATGRQADRERKRRDDDTRRKRYPPVAEVVFEILTEAAGTGLLPLELLSKARGKELASDELSVEQLLHALLDDNQRRIDSGRRPQFTYAGVEGAEPLLKLDAASEIAPMDVQLQFALTAGVPVENGRPVLRKPPQPHETEARGGGTPVSAEDLAALQTARSAGKDARRAMARVLRKRLAELDSGTFEKSVVRMMHKLSFREVKVAKRSKDGPLLTARRREGSLEIRYAVRMMKGNAPIERRQVQDLRRELGNYSAHVGLLVGAGDPRGDAKSEALAGALVFLWCGEGLAEQFFEAQTGVKVQTIELYEVDEAFFEEAKKDAEEARARREERHAQRDREEPSRSSSPEGSSSESHAEAAAGSTAEGAAPLPEGEPQPPRATPAEGGDGDDDEGDDGDEGDDDASAEGSGGSPRPLGQPGQVGDGSGRKRRRRRRGRRGRGPRTEGAPGGPGQAGAEGQAPSGGGGGGESPAPAPASAPPPSSEGGGGGDSDGGGDSGPPA